MKDSPSIVIPLWTRDYLPSRTAIGGIQFLAVIRIHSPFGCWILANKPPMILEADPVCYVTPLFSVKNTIIHFLLLNRNSFFHCKSLWLLLRVYMVQSGTPRIAFFILMQIQLKMATDYTWNILFVCDVTKSCIKINYLQKTHLHFRGREWKRP